MGNLMLNPYIKLTILNQWQIAHVYESPITFTYKAWIYNNHYKL